MRKTSGTPVMEDSWDLICVVMVILTLTFMTWLTLHVNGVL